MKTQKKPPVPSKQVIKYLNSLDSKTRNRLKKGIEKIPFGNIVPLEGSEDSFRLRIGDYRIIFKWL